MKARIILGLIMIITISSCSSSKKTSKKGETPEKVAVNDGHSSSIYIPEELRHLYLGMPFKEFFSQYQAVSVSEIMQFRKSVVLKNYSDKIKELTLYFDNEGTFPLYEFIIDYKDVAERDKVINELYGKPNFKEKEWEFDSEEGYPVRVWTFENKIIVAGFMAGTEWEGEE